ncbi:MAG: hypothetical protein QXX12_06500, partial [Nanopusillaceae archaeon]
MAIEKVSLSERTYKEELDKIVSNVTSTVNGIISPIYASLGGYFVAKENEMKTSADSFSENSKEVIKNYLNFLIKSGKVYDIAFGIAIRDIGYTPRTLEDLLRRPVDQSADREDRIASRYTSIALYGLLPSRIQELYFRKPINSLSEELSESLKKELVYLLEYLKSFNVKDNEISIFMDLLNNLTKLPYDTIKQQYLALSKIFKPDIAGVITVSTAKSLESLFKKFYNNIINYFEVKKEQPTIEQPKEQPQTIEQPKEQPQTIEQPKEQPQTIEQPKEQPQT